MWKDLDNSLIICLLFTDIVGILPKELFFFLQKDERVKHGPIIPMDPSELQWVLIMCRYRHSCWHMLGTKKNLVTCVSSWIIREHSSPTDLIIWRNMLQNLSIWMNADKLTWSLPSRGFHLPALTISWTSSIMVIPSPWFKIKIRYSESIQVKASEVANKTLKLKFWEGFYCHYSMK